MALAQSPAPPGQAPPPGQGTPPSTITSPPREWGPDAPPSIYPDPDIVSLDPSFGGLLLGITAIHRLWTGGFWLEGPTWSNQGQHLAFSDVQANVIYRYIWEDGHVSKFINPSYFGNGLAYDFQGRLLICQGQFRRLVARAHGARRHDDRHRGQLSG